MAGAAAPPMEEEAKERWGRYLLLLKSGVPASSIEHNMMVDKHSDKEIAEFREFANDFCRAQSPVNERESDDKPADALQVKKALWIAREEMSLTLDSFAKERKTKNPNDGQSGSCSKVYVEFGKKNGRQRRRYYSNYR